MVIVFAATLGRHGVFAFQRRVEQRGIARFDARAPSSVVAQLGRASCSRGMASSTLRVVNLVTFFRRAVGIFDLNCADFLDMGRCGLGTIDIGG